MLTRIKQINATLFWVVFLWISSIVFISQYTHLLESTPGALGKYFTVKWILYGHIIPGAIALLIGPLQFIRKLRNSFMRLHRVAGRIYLLAILLSAFCALVLTCVTTSVVGTMYTISLWFLVGVWLVVSAMTYFTIRKRLVTEHEQWSIRSYIVTFAIVVQNSTIKFPGVMDRVNFAEAAPSIIWFSWSVPLMVYQLYISIVAMNRRKQGL